MLKVPGFQHCVLIFFLKLNCLFLQKPENFNKKLYIFLSQIYHFIFLKNLNHLFNITELLRLEYIFIMILSHFLIFYRVFEIYYHFRSFHTLGLLCWIYLSDFLSSLIWISYFNQFKIAIKISQRYLEKRAWCSIYPYLIILRIPCSLG